MEYIENALDVLSFLTYYGWGFPRSWNVFFCSFYFYCLFVCLRYGTAVVAFFNLLCYSFLSSSCPALVLVWFELPSISSARHAASSFRLALGSPIPTNRVPLTHPKHQQLWSLSPMLSGTWDKYAYHTIPHTIPYPIVLLSYTMPLPYIYTSGPTSASNCGACFPCFTALGTNTPLTSSRAWQCLSTTTSVAAPRSSSREDLQRVKGDIIFFMYGSGCVGLA